ncbi:MAG: hypothetical protein KME21_29600, partial [Desmonostoc vinosum HA7617-LM4]|nr:hypothetical protein [Desmonostoc vinosum HA7617-LM4]
RAGLQKHWIVSLMLLSLLLMGVIGLVLAFNIQWAEEYYLSFESIQTYTMIPGIIVYILALVFGFIAVQRGVATALAAIALAVAVVGVSTVSVSGDKAFVLVLTGAAAIVGWWSQVVVLMDKKL